MNTTVVDVAPMQSSAPEVVVSFKPKVLVQKRESIPEKVVAVKKTLWADAPIFIPTTPNCDILCDLSSTGASMSPPTTAVHVPPSLVRPISQTPKVDVKFFDSDANFVFDREIDREIDFVLFSDSDVIIEEVTEEILKDSDPIVAKPQTPKGFVSCRRCCVSKHLVDSSG